MSQPTVSSGTLIDSGFGGAAVSALQDPVHALRLPANTVIADLFEHPFDFDFFQAVLVLERFGETQSSSAASATSLFTPPKEQPLRYRVSHSLAFPNNVIDAIDWVSEDQQVSMEVNFMGLTGPSGILPRYYTERLERIAALPPHRHRATLSEWLDTLNHRLVSLFFAAWAKYRFPAAMFRERQASQGEQASAKLFRVALSAVAGIDPQAPQARLSGAQTPPQASPGSRYRDDLLAVAGMLGQKPVNAANLASMASLAIGVPVKVAQFEGCWIELPESSQTRLGESGCRLGQSTLLGERIWTREQKIRLNIGPVSQAQFTELLPPTNAHAGELFTRLSELVRLALGPNTEFDLCPMLEAQNPPQVRLARDESATRLGMDSWLGPPAETAVLKDAIFPGQSV